MTLRQALAASRVRAGGYRRARRGNLEGIQAPNGHISVSELRNGIYWFHSVETADRWVGWRPEDPQGREE